MTSLTASQAIGRALKAEGIEVVLGMVGTHNADLFDGLYDVDGLRVITTRHEQGAGLMADGYARASGRIEVPLDVAVAVQEVDELPPTEAGAPRNAID
jgi:thiamine pyrophosphate-dependent acetolactate synthase large subunit-like protein